MNINEQKIEPKTQYILDENGNLVELLKDDAKPVEHPIKYKLKNAFEVFVLVKGTQNYWISNFGRCVNNLNTKDKARFYEHKQGNVHALIHHQTSLYLQPCSPLLLDNMIQIPLYK